VDICVNLWIKRGYDPQIHTDLGKGDFVVHPINSRIYKDIFTVDCGGLEV
jgi:hypothetical protein